MSAKTKNDEPESENLADITDEKPKHFKEQFEDEEVLLVFRKHPVVMRRALILFMLAILAGTIPALIKPTYSYFFGGLLAGLLLGLMLAFPGWVRWYFSVYIMTDKRFIQQTRSLLQVNVVDIGLEQIQMINYQISGLQETLLNFGTIVVQTYVGDLVIRDVHHPARVQKEMVHELREMGIHPTQRPFAQTDEDKRTIET
jgi:Bacterial PH domain